MELMELMRKRHSVRQYTDRPVEREKREVLNALAACCNEEGELNIQICYDEPEAFDSFLAHYGKFRGVKNYIALVGKKGSDEELGYYGEKLLLKAEELGLNTCWVALTYKKGKAAVSVEKGQKLVCVIAFGYGRQSGAAHKTRSEEEVLELTGERPAWLSDGVEAALLAPTAMNQQKFTIICRDGKVKIVKGKGFYTDVDLGIVRYHFEAATGVRTE